MRTGATAAEGRRSSDGMSRKGGRSTEAGQPGRVHVLGPDGQPQGVALRVGVTDGSFTEVVSGDLPEGAVVITGGGPRPAGAAPQPEAARRPARMF